jgi:hypothetical protein
MKDNKTIGAIFGAILGFVFVITCTSPLSSNASETAGSGKYQISITNVAKREYSASTGFYYDHFLIETIIDTETGQVVSRTKTSADSVVPVAGP